jgi:hypothetical protein
MRNATKLTILVALAHSAEETAYMTNENQYIRLSPYLMHNQTAAGMTTPWQSL